MRHIIWHAATLGALAFGINTACCFAAELQSDEDGEFLTKAVEVTKQEINDAQGAASASSHTEIRQAARAIESDHLKAEHELAHLARDKGLNITAVGSGVSESAADSDAGRIATLLKAHEEAVALFHQEAVRGMDPELKNFAQTTLPTLQRRLATLRSLQMSYPETS